MGVVSHPSRRTVGVRVGQVRRAPVTVEHLAGHLHSSRYTPRATRPRATRPRATRPRAARAARGGRKEAESRTISRNLAEYRTFQASGTVPSFRGCSAGATASPLWIALGSGPRHPEPHAAGMAAA